MCGRSEPVLRWLMWTGVRWGALGKEHRRVGWWRDAPAVLAISAVALVPVLVLAIVWGTAAGIVWLLERIPALLGVR